MGYFQKEFVENRKWLESETYSDLVALCQFLPGPSSSQVGMAIGLLRAGVSGSIAAWLGFTLPSALALITLGLGISHFDLNLHTGTLHGLKLVATAVIAQAIWSMARNHCAEFKKILIALISAATILVIPSSFNQVAVIAISAVMGILILNTQTTCYESHLPITVNKKTGLILLTIFFTSILILPLIANETNSYWVDLFANFFQTGSLVFGGGHVVLPLLQAQVVPSGWVSNETFLAGYAIAQAVPGPLFTFAAYLGAVSNQTPSGWLGGSIALIAIFLPSFLLVIGIIPFWNEFKNISLLKKSMVGVNASVVGLLMGAFYNPVWINTIFNIKDIVFVIVFYLMLDRLKLAPWLVILFGAFIGQFI